MIYNPSMLLATAYSVAALDLYLYWRHKDKLWLVLALVQCTLGAVYAYLASYAGLL